MPTDAKHADVTFPLAGIDRSASFDQQRPKSSPVGVSRTTVLGVNVRSHEVLTGRRRGGSRPGIVKYLTTRVGS